MAAKVYKTTVEITEACAARLKAIGGSIKAGIDLASYAPSVDALREARQEYLRGQQYASGTVPSGKVTKTPARREPTTEAGRLRRILSDAEEFRSKMLARGFTNDDINKYGYALEKRTPEHPDKTFIDGWTDD